MGLIHGAVDITADNRHLHGTAEAYCLHAANFYSYAGGRDFTGFGASGSNILKAGDVVVFCLDRVHGDLDVFVNGAAKGTLKSNIPPGIDLFWAVTIHDGGNQIRIMEWADSDDTGMAPVARGSSVPVLPASA